MNAPRWIRFEEDTPPAWKTRYWRVFSIQSGTPLGCVRWWGGWRKYCFFPEVSTIFEQQCLRDIAAFCEEQTTAYKEMQKARQAGSGP